MGKLNALHGNEYKGGGGINVARTLWYSTMKHVQAMRRHNRWRDQTGITLLETLIAMVVTSLVVLPSLGFATLSMGEQVAARTQAIETTNLGAVDLALLRDVASAKAVVPSTDMAGNPKPKNAIGDCLGGQGARPAATGVRRLLSGNG